MDRITAGITASITASGKISRAEHIYIIIYNCIRNSYNDSPKSGASSNLLHALELLFDKPIHHLFQSS